MQNELQPLTPDISTAADKFIVEHDVTPFFGPVVSAALKGSEEDAFRLGTYFYIRNRNTEDARQAIHWLAHKAKSGSVLAQVRLGTCLIRLQDFVTAINWLTLAAEQDDSKALLLLGRCQKRLGNKTLARQAFNRLAELGYDCGRKELIHLDELNTKKFGELLSKVYANDVHSQYDLGAAYLKLSQSATKLQDKTGLCRFGLKWLRTAATRGHEGARKLFNQQAQQILKEEKIHG